MHKQVRTDTAIVTKIKKQDVGLVALHATIRGVIPCWLGFLRLAALKATFFVIGKMCDTWSRSAECNRRPAHMSAAFLRLFLSNSSLLSIYVIAME